MSHSLQYNTHGIAFLPPQKISENQKTPKWRKACVDSLCHSIASEEDGLARSSRLRKQIALNALNSHFDKEVYLRHLNPFGIKSSHNTKKEVKPINLILSIYNTLLGEEINRPFEFEVIGKSGEVVQAKEELKVASTINFVKQQIMQQGLSKEEIQKKFQELGKWQKYSMQDIRETWGNHIIEAAKEFDNISEKFQNGWGLGLSTDEEIYHVGIKRNQPYLRNVNPIACDFDRNPDNPNIEDGDWFIEERLMTVGQIMDEWGDHLSDKEVKKLDDRTIKSGRNIHGTLPGFAYKQEDVERYFDRDYNERLLRVYSVVWKSMRKIGFLTYFDEVGRQQEIQVDGSYTLEDWQKEEGYTIEYEWINDIWEGVRIENDIYPVIQPLEYQYRSIDNPSDVKLPYVGRVWTNGNVESKSFIEKLLPLQCMYNIIWFNLEERVNEALGKKVLFDLAHLPRTEGFTVERFMDFVANSPFVFINSMEEGAGGASSDPTRTSPFNQYTEFDLSMSKVIAEYLQILDKIEDLMNDISGVSPQRKGSVHQNETVGGVERSIAHSSHITEPYFKIHNTIKSQVLNQYLEAAKVAFPESKKLQYITGDVERVMVEIDVDKFADSEYNVYVTDSAVDKLAFSKLEQVAQSAFQNGMVGFSDIIKMYRSSNLATYAREIEAAEDQHRMREEQKFQQEQETQRKAEEQKTLREQQKIQAENQRLMAELENNIDVATIKTMGFDQDTQDNDQIDVVEQGKQALERLKESNKLSLDTRKLNQKDREIDLKEKEMKMNAKLKREEMKTKLKNKVPGEE